MKLSKLLKNLTFQVITAVLLGVLVGVLWPDAGKQMKPLGDTFINAVKMVIAPIIFFTIVLGIAKMGDMKKVGKVGGKAFIYFEVVTTLALIVGLFVVNLIKPGAGLDYSKLEKGDVSQYTQNGGQGIDWVEFVTHIVPSNMSTLLQKGIFCKCYFSPFFLEPALLHWGKKGRASSIFLINYHRFSSKLSAIL